MISKQRIDRIYMLTQRYCQIAELLPAIDEIDPDDASGMAGIEVVCAELDKVGAEIDALMVTHDKLY
jgi:hypothetical protein